MTVAEPHAHFWFYASTKEGERDVDCWCGAMGTIVDGKVKVTHEAGTFPAGKCKHGTTHYVDLDHMKCWQCGTVFANEEASKPSKAPKPWKERLMGWRWKARA